MGNNKLSTTAHLPDIGFGSSSFPPLRLCRPSLSSHNEDSFSIRTLLWSVS